MTNYKVTKFGRAVLMSLNTWERMKRRLRRLDVAVTETPYRERKRSSARGTKREKVE